MRFFILVIVGLLAACAGPKLPAPNSADVRYDGRDRAVQVMVSSLQPPTAAALVANDGTRYPASGIALVSGPHVLSNPPPSVGLGIGGFGFSGCCSGFGSESGSAFQWEDPRRGGERSIRRFSADTCAT